MNRDIYRVLVTQFLTAFADNAVLFTAITMVMQHSQLGDWYIPALQASFLVAYVLFAPWVGRIADARPKRRVLFGANVVKAAGTIMLLMHIDPLFAYAVIGLGAATYSPAKYGILPELVDDQTLVKANGWIEGSTILAILSGTVTGAMLAEYSVTLALIFIIGLYIASALIALTIKHQLIVGAATGRALQNFTRQMRGLLATPRARFSTLGVSLFWAAATVLRVLLVAWAPAVLLIHSTTDIAMLTMFVALGIAVGSLLVPRLIPMAYLRRARLAAYVMGAVIVMLATVDDLWTARLALFCAGICGGLFVVPINAALQEIGFKTIGSGGAVAIQNFFENLTMLLASGIYSIMAGAGTDPVATMIGLGIVVMIATTIISWRLPRDTGVLFEAKAD
ncbi:MAG: lysophospholipid transporter LplT [Gammaproteobacteria bacterium]|jgi:MFS transporter, LPLT family, lysophospholipid transporter|nr:lysophospholipid transporter LplT [Gammaproteobacteria bacterium]